MTAAPRLVTLGEVMATVAATEPGPLRHGAGLRLGFAGAEATVAIGVSRLGHPAAWTGRVGDDATGAMILAGLRSEGVDLTTVRTEPHAPTGLMLREQRTSERLRVTYYRTGLAGSRLAPEDVDERLIASARVLHVTGITPALSDSARAAVDRAVNAAVAAGVTVSLDVNYRSLLWSRDEAARALTGLAARADVIFAGPEEASLLVPEATPTEMATALTKRGPAEAVLKLGAHGALATDGSQLLSQKAVPVTAVDPIGAGDAFVAGYLSGLLDARPLAERLHRAAVCGAFAVSVTGDWEGLPRRPELDLLTADDITR